MRLHPNSRLIAAALTAVLTAGVLEAVAEADTNEGIPTVSAAAEAKITVGGLHSCAVLAGGAVQCWGSNDQGQLGNGTVVTSTDPVTVTGFDGSDNAHTAVAVAAGNTHTCALLADTTVKCWGLAANGQVGDGSFGDKTAADLTKDPQRRTPVTVVKDTLNPPTPLSGVVAVAAGGFHTCAIVKDGSGNQTAWCWGDDGAGQLGDGKPGDRSSIAQPVLGLPAGVNVTALALGEFHSCALLADSTVWCWGANTFDQLGFDPGTDKTKLASAVPVQVSGVTDDATNNPIKAITSGYGHVCALLKDNTARCWGENSFGQLGYQTDYESTDTNKNYQAIIPLRTMKPSATPGTVQRTNHTPTLLDQSQDPHADGHFIAISAGEFHTCALIDDGSARCWGEGGRGQLGTDPYAGSKNQAQIEDSAFSVPVNGLSNATAITAGGFHTCASLSDGSMKCWGYNFYGQLGSYRAQSSTPVQVTAVTGARAVSAGTHFACALVDKTFTASPASATAPPAGQPFCWGDNSSGELGAGFNVTKTSLRTAVANIGTATALDAGNGYACANAINSTTPQCWGRNLDGELGNGATTDSNVPVTAGLTNAATVSAGGALGSAERGLTCSVTTAGKVSCWGRNLNGQLGNRTNTDSSSPVTVQNNTNPDFTTDPTFADLTGITSVVTGGFHACALASDSTVWCWGANDAGQLGDNTTTDRNYAVHVQQDDADKNNDHPLTGVVALAAGSEFTCAIMTNGHVKCWGADDRGQLGDGGGSNQSHPVDTHVIGTGTGGLVTLPPAVSSSPARSITAGDIHACVRLDDDSLACWGGNTDGQLGDGSTSDETEPVGIFPPRSSDVPATSVPVIRSISASRSNTCVVFVDTTVYCWGDNTYDQLGDGLGATSVNPVKVTLASTL